MNLFLLSCAAFAVPFSLCLSSSLFHGFPVVVVNAWHPTQKRSTQGRIKTGGKKISMPGGGGGA
jgi:hypothetical protein